MYDVIVELSGEPEKLAFQVPQPRSFGWHVEPPAKLHAGAYRLRSNRLVVSHWKFFEAGMTSALAYACLEKRTDAASDLTFLKRPQCRPPALHHVAETFDPYVRAGLLSPQVDEKQSKLAIETKDTVDRVVTALAGHSEVACTVESQSLDRRGVQGGGGPFFLKIGAFFPCLLLLLEPDPIFPRCVLPY